MLGLQGFSSNRQEREREIMSGEKTTKGIVSKAWVGQKVQESVQGVCVEGVSNGKNRPGVRWEYS